MGNIWWIRPSLLLLPMSNGIWKLLAKALVYRWKIWPSQTTTLLSTHSGYWIRIHDPLPWSIKILNKNSFRLSSISIPSYSNRASSDPPTSKAFLAINSNNNTYRTMSTTRKTISILMIIMIIVILRIPVQQQQQRHISTWMTLLQQQLLTFI